MNDRVNIRPTVSMLSVLKHLNYKPWYALAEYVDNALDSHRREKKSLRKIDARYKLEIKIDINQSNKKITITDNAGGIHKSDFSRAFKTAEIPPDSATGLSEFGMGMKSASCWFTNVWVVRTKSVSDEYEYEVKFNISEIVKKNVQELNILKRKVRKDAHYTVIELMNVHDFPVKKTLGKIKKHLTSMYRQFVREGEIKIVLNGEELTYDEPQVLLAAFYKNEKGPAKSWRKEINIKIDNCHWATGFVAIRETGSTADAGFALFRRNRVIQDSGEDGYRPETIFGNPNSYAYQRIFGEIFLDGFGVSHTKDGIQWDGLEEVFLNKLKIELKKDPDILAQAEGFRKRQKPEEIMQQATTPLERTSNVLAREGPKVIGDLRNQAINKVLVPEQLSRAVGELQKVLKLDLDGVTWEVHIDLCADETVRDWVDIGEQYVKRGKVVDRNTRKIGIRVGVAHPFMVQFSTDSQKLEPLLRIAVAIAIAEVIARESGVKDAAAVRANINELMGSALSKLE